MFRTAPHLASADLGGLANASQGLWNPLEAAWAPFESLGGNPRASLLQATGPLCGVACEVLSDLFWGPFGALLDFLELSWAVLGLFWACGGGEGPVGAFLGRSWALRGGPFDPVGLSWNLLRSFLGLFPSCRGSPGAVMGPCWEPLGPS